MKKSGIILIVIVITIVCICIFLCNNSKKTDAERYAESALIDLAATANEIPEVSSDYLEENKHKILIVAAPYDMNEASSSDNMRENMTFFPSENTRYWPYYYYSFPYNYKYGGAWPPGMYSRLNYWSPGYYTGTGWSYYMRPGMGYDKWPRNRWIRNTQNGKRSYYFLSNRDDLTHDSANYADLPLMYS